MENKYSGTLAWEEGILYLCMLEGKSTNDYMSA